MAGLDASAAKPYQPVMGDPVLAPWRWRAFPELSSLGPLCMVEDEQRAMWFGLEEGVAHYDGIHWKFYGAAEGLKGSIECLVQGPNGLYAGGEHGISRYRNGQWRRIFPSSTNQTFTTVYQLAFSREGSLWAATDLGALRGEKGEFTLYTDEKGSRTFRAFTNTAPCRVELWPAAIREKQHRMGTRGNRSRMTEAYADRQGQIWLGTAQGEILRYQPSPSLPGQKNAALPTSGEGAWVLYNEMDGIQCDMRPRLLQLDDGMLWVVFQGVRGRPHRFAGKTWQLVPLTGMPDTSDCLLQTRDGTLWIGCQGAICAYQQGSLKRYEPPLASIPSVHTFLCQSSDGALWVGGRGVSVARLDYQTPRWTVYQDLNFQWESPSGTQWFLHRDGQVIAHEGTEWKSYGVEDGVIDAPVAVLGTRSGDIWVAGSHTNTAATARFKDGRWTRFTHDRLSWGVDWRAIFEAADGSLWFGAAVNFANLGRDYVGGVMQFREGQWIHHGLPLDSFYGLGQSQDGRIWGGRDGLCVYDGRQWQKLLDTSDRHLGRVESLFTSREQHLWVSTRQNGLFCFDGQKWIRHHIADGLQVNALRSFVQTADGSYWAATDYGLSRYDGQRWVGEMLPAELNMPREGGALKPAPSGALWINRSSRNWNRRAWPQVAPFDLSAQEFWTVCHQTDKSPPDTTITLGLEKVAPPGNATIAWKGTDAWNLTGERDLQYSFRLDGGPWSGFSALQSHTFLELKPGRHHFEVRARDRDFNLDPTPAVVDFQVMPPVWREPWFIMLMTILGGVILAQAFRVWQQGRRLQKTNLALAAEIEKEREIAAELQQKKACLEESHRRLEEEMEARQAAALKLETSVSELREALNQIKTLRGIVPICAGCKKIRDDKGYWEQVESYVSKHSHAQFSHGLCPECVQKFFP